MTPDVISMIAQETVVVAVKLVAPILLSSLVVGLIISMFQAATSINEQTLTFIPKLATIIIVLMILGPWMLQVIVDFFQDLMLRIPLLIG
ncbi:MAG: flagellar biosynthesis protein FliQ [Methyloprofundus sp.]|nr:flagellar biosynthesis protein FliQ [Methyloprofundus sp.]MBW6453587.1 flagellar biosynthesis protein FliQ [Methyloprofundus sp.]MDT8426910.1 flagellar biosynthesis protein FliQ [Methyloprofundus sp.]